MDKKRIVFILNPISGAKSKKQVPQVIDECIDKEMYEYVIEETKRAGHATEVARNAVADGVDIVVAIGGDGTVNEVARAVAGSKTAMAIIPFGSGNGLARHLMIPINVKGAINVINQGVVHALDYGIINGMPFFCTCGMGFDAYISMKFAQAGKRGPLTYLENVLREGLVYKPENYIVEDESGKQEYKAFLISVANASQYGNDAYIAPQASMSDGLMDVIIMERFGVLDAANVSYDMMNKTLDKNPRVRTFRTKHLHIRREKPGVVHYDGDPIITDADIDISIREKGINIVVNPKADKRRRKPTRFQSIMSLIMNGASDVRSGVAEAITETGGTVASDISEQAHKVIKLGKSLVD